MNRVKGVLAGFFIVLGLLLFALPMPYHTEAEGVVWLPEQAILRAGGNGFVSEVAARAGEALKPGQVVARSQEPSLNSSIAAQEARVEEARARYDAAWGVNPAQAGQLEEEVHREQAALDRLQDEAAQLTLRARAGGVLLMEQARDLPGRFLKKGEVMGYVVGDYVPLVRVVVPQSEVDLVRLSTRDVEIKFPQAMGETWPARLSREVPKAGRELPSPALGQGGGGNIAMDPRDEKGTKTLESLFEFELELPGNAPAHFIGSRVHVRFEHPSEPIGVRGWRALRRLFLSHFHV